MKAPESHSKRRTRQGLAFLGIFVLVVATLSWLLWNPSARSLRQPSEPPRTASPDIQVRSPFEHVRFPTEQPLLPHPPSLETFQPTSSGRLESALYGTTRTDRNGRPSLHEGIDIAALSRDRRGQPLDHVHAIADGTVAYANPHPARSNYGAYVVVTHPDPLGPIYTLYAHLASLASNVQAGHAVQRGAPLGLMGNTPSSDIPLSRSHLHFEIGLIQNSRFTEWATARGHKCIHGPFHGWNLMGLDPLAFFKCQALTNAFTFRSFLETHVPAFEAMIATKHQPDFFDRYPSLWNGAPYQPGPVVLACTVNGIPLAGRNATPEECGRLGGAAARIERVNPEALGGNGPRLIVQSKGQWGLSQKGTQWLDAFTW